MKFISIVLITGLLLGMVPVGASATVTPLSTLSAVEELLYGQVQSGALLERVDRVEQEIYGTTQAGAVLVRIDRVQSFLDVNSSGSASLKLKLNLAEWGFSARLTGGQPLVNRLDKIETELLGAPEQGFLAERIEQLMMLIWGTTQLDVKALELKEQSLVKIRLLSSVDSGESRVGEDIQYRVIEDVIVEGRVVIPAGSEGVGTVTEVSSAGMLGRDGRVVIDFGSVPALDGNAIRIKVDEKATEKNRSLELAAGASMAGILLLGPIGLAGGYFIRGRDVDIPAGTEFFVETERSRRVTGFLFRPGHN